MGEDEDGDEHNSTRWHSSASAPAFARPRYIPTHYPPDLRLAVARKGGRERGLDRLSGARASTEITFHARRIADARGLAGQSGKEKDKDKMDYSSKRARPRRPSSAPECAIRRLQIDLFVRHILTFTFVFTISLGERGRIGITLFLAEEYVLSILTCA